MRVLVACEFSGVVRDAFRTKGHAAYSCDLLPTLSNSEFHIQRDVRDILNDGWDLMIAHPPCTYLCNSGVKWLYKDGRKENGLDPDRWSKLLEAEIFFKELINAPINKICIENPIYHCWGALPRHTQIVQPWMFSHGETKATCLWLKNLPKLEPTNIVKGRKGRVHKESPGPDRWKRRSITYQGIADAMASQWG